MLEMFEQIWSAPKGAEEQQFQNVQEWLCENRFPVCSLPNSYIELLKECNGGNFTNGNREYQMFSIEEAVQAYEIYNFSVYMPFAFPFAMDGCGNFYILNLRKYDEAVYAISSGDLEWEECRKIADNFINCLVQKEALEELML